MTVVYLSALTFFSALSGMLLGWLMGFLSLFLILLVLIQRGRGGGLTGALGGPGGQSAFGSKAGDTFTIITVAVAAIWGFVCAFTMWLLGTHASVVTTTPPTTIINVGGDVGEMDGLNIPSSDSMGLSGMTAGETDSDSDSAGNAADGGTGDAADGEAVDDDGAAVADATNMELTPADGTLSGDEEAAATTTPAE